MAKNYEVRLKHPKKYKLNHFRMFVVKYLGPTDTKGSRVKITDTRFYDSVTIAFDYTMDSVRDIAIQFLLNKKIKIEGFSCDDSKDLYHLFTLDFDTNMKVRRK